MANKITCTCGHSWNKSDSSKKDMRVCHVCGKDNTMKNGGWLDKFDAPQAQNGIEGTMGGLTDKGFNFNPAWGGAWRDGGILQPPMAGADQTVPMYAMGGSIPGSVGFTYARTAGAAPSEGPYAKKTLPSAQNGAEMKFYQQGLDWTPRNISRNGGWLDKYNEDIPEAQAGQVLQQRYSTGPMMGDLARQSGILENLRQAEIRKTRPDLEAKLKKEKEQLAARARYEAMPKIGPARERNYSEQVQAEEQRRRLNQQYADQNPEVITDESGNIIPSGYGRFMQTYGPSIEKFGRSLETPLSAMSLATGVGSIASNTLRLGASALEKQIGRNLLSKGIKNITGRVSPIINSLDDAAAYAQLDPVGIMGNRLNALSYNPTTVLNTANNTITGVQRNLTNSGIEASDLVLGENNTVRLLSEEIPKQNNFGSIYTLNPITALGDLGDYKYYRKIGSGGGIKDLIESGAIRSGGGYDAPYFSPNTTWEGYRGTFAVGLNPKQVEGLQMINKNKGGLQRGYKSSLDEIPLSEGATGVFRRFPFSSAYIEIPISSVLDPSKRTLREKILLNPTLANIQHGSEEALRYGIKGSVAQYIGNELYGTEKDPTPLGTPVLLPAVSYLKKDFEKSFLNKPQQKEEGGEVVKDNEGYWNPQNWGKPVEINSNKITMEGVLEPLLGVSDTGDTQMMYPGKNYTFNGTKVVEYPREHFRAKDGKSVNRADEYPLEKLDNLLNFTNYNKPKAKNGWLEKYK